MAQLPLGFNCALLENGHVDAFAVRDHEAKFVTERSFFFVLMEVSTSVALDNNMLGPQKQGLLCTEM